MRALHGFRVLDLSIAMAGPLAAMRLGDLGADVIKVEPVTGEWQRHNPAGGAGGRRINASFMGLNRNKRSLAVDLKRPEGHQILLELAATSDVFLQNYRPGVARRLGVDYASIRAVCPEIVYVSISGYGEDGPYANRPGQDLLLQAMSGAMRNVGRESDPPAPSGTYAIDAITAYSAFEAALAGLLHRERTGKGQFVAVNMLDAAVAVQAQELSIFTIGHVPQRRSAGNHGHVYIRAPYGVFETADGYLALAMPSLETLGRLIGSDELAAMDDQVDGHRQRDRIDAIVRQHLVERTSKAWLDAFSEAGIWAGPVYDYDDLLHDPQVAHNGSFLAYEHPTEGEVTMPGFPWRFAETPAALHRAVPLAGEHTVEVLGELGYREEAIEELAARDVVRTDVPGEPGEP